MSVRKKKTDIIFITETWVKSSVQNNELSQRASSNEYYLEGYILFQYKRKGIEGGGVFVYVK